MSLYLSCQSLSKSFGTRDLFTDLSLSVFAKDRIGLIGPNGAGKSTLLNILAGLEKADSGQLSPRRDLKIGYVPQSCDFPDLPPEEILLSALEKEESVPSYDQERLVKTWMSKLGFPPSVTSASHLSGGWKKRLGIAKAMISSPDLLLLDEPTNHLDLEGILWLEKFLSRDVETYLMVSHDRYFLQNTVNRVIEIDPVYPKGIMAIDGSYFHFLEHKEIFLAGQIEQQRSLASKARRELDWLRQTPKARTTKSKSRVEEAHSILEELSQIQTRNLKKKADIDFAASERETRKLITVKNLRKDMGDKILFSQLDFTLSPGTRLGLMGPNGSGKTTLLRLLAEEISPDQGTIKQADKLKIIYFDQHRAQLPLDISLRHALSPEGDFVLFRGQRIHVNGWCKRFLFAPDLLDMPLAKLSGGERARISIAHLMLQPADILLLDEPTNDLDIATLETLEESLLEFPGAIVLITHDRCMLDRICNAVLGLGSLHPIEIFADYAQWEAAQKKKNIPSPEKEKEEKKEEPPPVKKLSYAEKKEYDQIEGKITALEQEVQQLNHLLETAEVAQNTERLKEVCSAIALAENKIEQLYLRWEELNKRLLA